MRLRLSPRSVGTSTPLTRNPGSCAGREQRSMPLLEFAGVAAVIALLAAGLIVRGQRRERRDFSAPGSNPDVRDCHKCGAINRGSATFCVECLARLR